MLDVATNQQTAASMNWEQTDLYRFFARLFAPPSRGCFEFLAQPSVGEHLRDLGRYLGCGEKVPEFNWFSTYDSYEASYISLFDVGLPEPVVPLFESAHDKTHPPQEIALENTCFYDVLGLRSNPAAGVPDYLVTQLEFLSAVSFTQENASEDTARLSMVRLKSEFLERHLLNWLPTAARKLSKAEATGFPLLMDLLVRFLHRERSAFSHPRQGNIGGCHNRFDCS